jgi:hypothetical protein
MTHPSVRPGRWLVVGLIACIFVAAASAADSSAQVRPSPLPCDPHDPAPLCVTPVPTSTARCHDWIVGKVRVVGGREQLLVSAVCAVRGGERLELRRVEPQGINPANLLLELVVSRGPFPPGPATQEVRVYHSEVNTGYKSVTILPDGPTLPVEELSAT